MVVHKRLVTKRETYSYYENEPHNYTNTVLFVSPGAINGRQSMDIFISFFPENVKVICPDLPGRGEAHYIADNSMENIAKWVNDFVEALNLKDAILVGISYGGNTVNEMLAQSHGIYKKAFMIASGEEFTPLKKFMMTVLFYPPTVSKICEKVWIYVLLHLVHLYEGLPEDISFNFRGLFRQHLAIINYRLDTGRRDTTPVALVFLMKDSIINPSSIQKLQTIYSNSTTHFLNMPHSLVLNESEQTELKSFLTSQLSL